MAGNGAVTFLDNSETAGRKAAKDVALFAASDNVAGGPGFVAAGIGAAAGVISALSAAGNFGINLANAVRSDKGELEISITNYSSNAVVVYGYNPHNCDVTNVPEPLAPGEDDVFVLTKNGSFDDSTAIEIDLMIGGDQTCVACAVNYSFAKSGYNPGRWGFQVTIDGENSDFKRELQIFGATFTGNTGYPSFSLYSATTESGNGSLSVSVYDTSAD